MKRVKVDIVSCEYCKTQYIKLSSKLNHCDSCKSKYNINLLGEILKIDDIDYTKLKNFGKIKLTNELRIRYGIRKLKNKEL